MTGFASIVEPLRAFSVHCRNRSMLKAVKKAGIPMLGRVSIFSFPGCYLTVWNKRFLQKGGDNWPIGL